jgi:RHS repeat-associated protein
VTATAVAVTDATHLTATVTIAAGAALGASGVTVTTASEVAAGANLFTVSAGTPVVTVINPAGGHQGQVLAGVAITGQYTHFAAGSTVSFGNPGVTATAVAVTDATHLTATVTIAAGAALGASGVTVTTASEVAADANLFTVSAGVAAASPTFSPAAGTYSSAQTVTITSTTVGASIHYTTDGSTPSETAGTLYATPVTVSSTETIQAMAYGTGWLDSPVASAVYTIVPNVYAHRRPITIDHTKVPNTDQSNFPVLISGVYPFLATTANGGQVQNANGYDIIFTADFAGTTQLNHEIESYDPATGTINMWVQVPNVLHTCDTVIYIAYGNAAITGSRENKTGVWDSNYQAVLHLDETTGTTVIDSTANGNAGTKVSISSPTGTPVGKIGGAQIFNGTSDFIAMPPSLTGGLSTFSLSFWALTTDTGSNGTYWNQPQFLGDSTAANNSGDFGVATNGGALAMWSGLNSGGDNSFVTGSIVNDNNWHHIAAVNNGSAIHLYLDGADTGRTLSSGLALDSYGWYLGAQHYYAGGAAFYHQGAIDEFRFSNAARSADWIATEFNNQSSPSTFAPIGPENTVGVTVCPGSVILAGAQTQQFTAIVTNASDQSVTWSSSPTGAGSVDPASGIYTAPAAVTAAQQATVAAASQADHTAFGNATVNLLPPSSFAAIRINSGGPTYVDPAGRVWAADTDFTTTCGGNGYPTSFVAPTGLDGQYADALTCNSGASPQIAYQIPVANLDYLVNLKFAEPSSGCGSGCRIFSVAVNGQTNSVLQRVDVAANAGGPQLAWDAPSFPVSVTNGQITIDFSGTNNPPIVSAIEIVPAGSIEVLPEVVTLSAGQTQQFTVTQPGGTNPSVTWSITPGNLGTISSTGLYTAPASISAAATVTVTAVSTTNTNVVGTALITLSPTAASSFPALRINSGGPTYVDPAGRVWVADTGFATTCGGNGYPIGFVAPTGLDGEYADALTCNSGTSPQITYQIAVPNMEYLVTLKFAEPSAGCGAGCRIFSAAVNGQTNSVLERVDVAANAGGSQLAWDAPPFPVSVNNGQITIAFSGINNPPIISAIEIVPASSIEVLPETATLSERQILQFTAIQPGVATPSVNWSIVPAGLGSISSTGVYAAPASITAAATVTVIAVSTTNTNVVGTAVITLSPTDPNSFPALRINSGGPTYVDPAGRVWVADTSFTTTCGGNGYPIGFVAPTGLDGEYADALTCNSGTSPQIAYQIPVPNMDYLVTLKFAEPSSGCGSGCRIFSAAVNGQTNSVLERVDVAANAGAPLKPWDAPPFPVSVNNGQITIAFSGINNPPIISAIEIVPASSIEVLPETATLSERQTLQFTAIQPGVATPSVNWSIVPAGLGSISSTGVYAAPASIAAAATVTVIAASASNPNIQGTAVISLSPTDPNSFPALRINSGGPTYVDPAGRVWAADMDFATTCGGNGYSTGFVAPTGLDGEYADALTCNSGTSPQIAYQIPVSNMDYLVTLKFAEPSSGCGAGCRIFSAAVNGETNSVLERVDVAANAGGPQLAWDAPPFPVSVNNGQITIALSGINNPPIISAIEIVPANSIEVLPETATLGLTQAIQFSALAPGGASPAVTWSVSPAGLGTISATGLYVAPASLPAATTVTVIATSVANPSLNGTAIVNLSTADPSIFTALRINSGGPTYTDPAGRVWAADTDFTTTCGGNGSPFSFTAAGLDGEYIDGLSCNSGTSPQMTYQIPVPNMDYLVTLKFAEPSSGCGPGCRIFSVAVNGQTNSVLQRVDVAASAGAPQSAWDTTVPVSVNSGQITIAFTSINNPPIINAIQVALPGTVHVTPATAVLYANQAQQFAATVDGPADVGVNWTITPPNAGSISASGLFTAPSVIATRQTVTVMATNALSGEMTATATITLMPPISLTVAPAAQTLSAGDSQQFTATLNNTLAATSAVTWSINPNVGAITAAGVYTAPVAIASQQLVTVTATSQADPTKSGSAVITLSPTPVVSQLSLVPPVVGPNPVGATQTLSAILTTPAGKPASGVTISFSVSGPNATAGTATTDATGAAQFAYTGLNAGTDTVQATANSMVSNTASVSWLIPVQPVSTSTVFGQFFFNQSNSYTFDIPANATPVFTQWFPTVNFNVPAGAIPGDTSGVRPSTQPFTDVTTDQNGHFTGTIAAQGNGYQAYVGPMASFQAVFTGSYTVAGAGDQVITIYVDNSFVLGIGGGATRVSGVLDSNPAPVTTFEQLPVIGAASTSIGGFPIAVHFPGPGTYPYELDFTECCGWGSWFDTTALTMMIGNGTASGMPPSGTIALTPNTVPQMSASQSVTFTALATDAAGNPVPNAPVALNVSGEDMLQLSGVTGANGQVSFTYTGASVGIDTVQALATVSGMFAISNQVTVPWGTAVAPPPGTSSNAFTVTVDGTQQLTLPDTAMYSASASDTRLGANATFSFAWTQVSGPDTVTFSAAQQAITSVTFPVPGVYVLQVTATDSLGSQTLSPVGPITVFAPNTLTLSSGWLGSPADHTQVTGLVPITVASGETLVSGTLSYYPTANPDAVTILNSSTSGTGTLATLDTTLLANGSYYILLQATDSNGKTMASGVDILVGGDYKPGRVTTTVTDLIVPAPGLPIQISRTYDSLVRSTSSDFGYGWNLGVNVQLDVSADHDVTLTINGQRRTFYFTPTSQSMLGVLVGRGVQTPWFAAYTPEPGLHGTLTIWSNGSSLIGSNTGCLFDWLLPYGNSYFCYDNAGTFNPGGYVYTDPYGRVYNISSTGGLQSIQDIAGNTLTVTPAGITSSNGLNVPFVRDNLGRITQITDPLGQQYNYGYDSYGNLASVTYPGVATPAQYTYDPTHLYTGGTDERGNPMATATYDASGRLQSAVFHADPATSYQTSYSYETTNPVTVSYPDGTTATGFTTTTTNPADANGNVGAITRIYDSYGDLISSTDPLNHTTLNEYDAYHNLVSVTDPLGHTATSTYDSNGHQTSVTYPKTATSVNTTRYTVYNQYGLPTQVTDELGNVHTITFDSNFWPKLASDSLGPVYSFVFNANGTIAANSVGYDLAAAPETATTFAYDTYGNLTAKTDPLGRQTQYSYDTLGRLTSTKAPAGGSTTYTYDALGHLTNVAAPLGRTTSSTYDPLGNKTTSTDADGSTTTYIYDALNRVSQITYPTSPKTSVSYTYDFRGNAIDTADQAGHVTHNVYDLAGRLTSTTKAYGTANAATTSYTYYYDGRKAAQTDPNNNTTTYNYDPAGKLTSVLDPTNSATQMVYDDAGNRIQVTDPKGHVIKQQYDMRRRLTQTTYSDATTTVYSYDGPGNLTGITDQANKTVNYTYDYANQLRSVIQSASPNPQNVTSYAYDLNGNLTTLTDTNSHTTQNGFDLLNQLNLETMPAGQTQTRTYDAAGNLQTLTDYNGKTTTYAYDALNRLLSRTPDPSLTDRPETFTYTPTGKRATMTDASGTTNYTYDAQNRLQTKATPQGTLTYTYDTAGNVASMASADANGVSVVYAYDSLNRLSKVVDNRLPANQNTTTYSYDAAYNLATVTYPNGLQSTFTYDDLNRLNSLNATKAAYSYTLGPAGNRESAVELGGRTVNWTYDGVYRLTNEAISLDPHSNNGSVSYGLDPVGNRLNQTSTLSGISTGTFAYDADDRLATETYDNNGSTTVSGARNFAYDFANRLQSMNSGAVTIQYDGDGNRVAKTVNGVTTRYLVDSLNPTGYPQVVEELVDGVVQRAYTYGLQRIDQNQLVGNDWTPSFYGYDGFGSVRLLTDATGTVTDTYDYDAWGNAVHTAGSTPNVYLYRGEQYDPDLRLYYLRARYFNPLSGRFLSRDPESGHIAVPATLHRYSYAAADPVNRIDPRGHEAVIEYAVRALDAVGGAKGVEVIACTAYFATVMVSKLLGEAVFENEDAVGVFAMKIASCGMELTEQLTHLGVVGETVAGDPVVGTIIGGAACAAETVEVWHEIDTASDAKFYIDWGNMALSCLAFGLRILELAAM